jgi:DNA-binding GntR family transcriptional regulator
MAADRVYDAIYAAVIDHLPPGARLREEELAQTFAVSRTLVRQALHRLAQDGVVLLRPNRGAQVPSRHAPRARMCSMRAAWSSARWCAAGRRAGQGAGDGPEASRRCRGARHRGGRPPRAIRLSGAFHVELARLSGNPLFVRMLEELLPTTSLLMALYKPPGEPMCVAHSRVLLGKLEPTAPPQRPPRCAATSSEDRSVRWTRRRPCYLRCAMLRALPGGCMSEPYGALPGHGRFDYSGIGERMRFGLARRRRWPSTSASTSSTSPSARAGRDAGALGTSRRAELRLARVRQPRRRMALPRPVRRSRCRWVHWSTRRCTTTARRS